MPTAERAKDALKAGKWLPAKRAAGNENRKDNAGAGEDDAVVFFVVIVVENNNGRILLSMSPEAATFIVIVIIFHILNGRCNCPTASKEDNNNGDE